MTTRRSFMAGALGGAAFLGSSPLCFAQGAPAGYPADYAELIAKAKKEGRVAIYTSTDEAQGQPLVDAFKQTYGIAVDYNGLGTTEVYNRVISEGAAGQVGADISWTSSMDLQMVLADKGLLDAYASPEAAQLGMNRHIYFVDSPSLIKAASLSAPIPDAIGRNIIASRLYWLGADVCRLSTLLLNEEMRFNRTLMDGATGSLRVTRSRMVERDLQVISFHEANLAKYNTSDFDRLVDLRSKRN